MPTESKTQIYYINLGGSLGNAGALRFAWRGKKDAYKKAIADELGVVIAKDTDSGLLFGMNNPRPAEVRISYVNATGGISTAIRFCEPDKLNDVTTGGKLNGKKITIGGKDYNINGVTIKSN